MPSLILGTRSPQVSLSFHFSFSFSSSLPFIPSRARFGASPIQPDHRVYFVAEEEGKSISFLLRNKVKLQANQNCGDCDTLGLEHSDNKSYQ